jgi:hypothetical protein
MKRATTHYKPAAKRMTVVIPIRVTLEQHQAYKAAAKKAGCALSYWLRDVADAATK